MEKMLRPETRWAGGVCAALGKRFNTDPNIFRLAFIILSLSFAFPIFIYFILWFAIPPEHRVAENRQQYKYQSAGAVLGAVAGAYLGFNAPIWMFGYMNGLILITTGIMGFFAGIIAGIAISRSFK